MGGGGIRRFLRALAGLLMGLVAGVAVVLAVVAFRAHVQQVFIHSFGELVSWISLPVVVGPVVGVWAALRMSARRFWRSAGLLGAGFATGIVLGAALGAVASTYPSAPWVGGIMGAAAGLLLVAIGLLVARMRSSASPPSPAVALIALLACGACNDPPPREISTIPPPDTAEVEAVVFLLGDPGMARTGEYPVLPRMKGEIERWAGAIGDGGNVAMLVLGDIVYPSGLHPADHERRTTDSLRIADQIDLVSGPAADSAGARALFIAGNHDWGQQQDFAGAVRLVRLQEFLDAWDGPAAGRLEVVPEPGTGGPGVVDMGESLRLILLDTAWWLLGSDQAEKDAVIDSVRSVLATAGDRRVVMAAHHPLDSGGPHGADDLGQTLGIRTLLKKAGILLQDLDSRPYVDLRRRLTDAFAQTGHPDIFAGGHDHSLQVFSSWETSSSRSLVVGSASKLSPVQDAPGMVFGRSEPGYGTIFVLRDGSVHFRLDAAPSEFLECGGQAAPDCMSEGLDAYRTVWAEEIEIAAP